ncbi:MAG TPA: primosomal protein N' [Fimbriimonadaceae bacterium]|nr:primosomal protein N' [Fimbriimonadaceae bacterium]HRJ97122.1 primosomal protein N' [Fimbriimonadaceae bacterium]
MTEPGPKATLSLADVAIDARSGGADAVYTYRADPDTGLGDAYFVPLGPRSVMGYVVGLRYLHEDELGFSASKLRPLGLRVENASLPPTTIELLRFVADQYLCPLPTALSLATPPGVRHRLVTEWRLIEDAQTELPLSPLQDEALRVLREAGGRLSESKGETLDPGAKKALQHLRAKGLVSVSLTLDLEAEKRRLTGLVRLTSDEEKIERFLATEAKKKPAQAITVMRLQGAEGAILTVQEIKALGDVTDQTVKALLTAGLLERVEGEVAARKDAPKPNPQQAAAISAVAEAIRGNRFEPFLLYGVTGSGKTEVYLRCAAEALRRGRQVLFLVPEIALTAQVIAQLRERFGRSVAVLHSGLPPTERLDNWMRIRAGEASVVLGTRSALFAPIRDLGLVIVDEEHEPSYKQENPPRYHAKPLARFLARRFEAPIVLGSATPSIETFYEASKGGWKLLELRERAAGAALPAVRIIDMRRPALAEAEPGPPSLFCAELREAMAETLSQQNQIILFLNRRAYAPFLICRDCGRRWVCPSCAVTLSYHRREALLKCHHCGHTERPPDVCPTCEGDQIRTFGAGVERVEEAVLEAMPEATVGRLDRDVARRKGALEETLALFRAGAIDILVGTQMVAKGLDFPRVTLVGIVAADLALNMPDFRATERAFQVLSQVAGRAGRGDRPGRVIIQTFNPENPAIVCARDHDFLRFYDQVIIERRQARYPPFTRLVNIVLQGEDRSEVTLAAREVREMVASTLGVQGPPTLLGPVDCVIERLNGRWRRHLLLKLLHVDQVRAIGQALEAYDRRGVLLTVDVDPYSLI